MKKHSIRLIGLLALVLTALPCRAQLRSYECWFDNQQGASSGALSGSEQTLELSLDAKQLKSGLHTFCIRAQQSDGMYSPVYTSTFLKFAAIDACMVEYWVDNLFDLRDAVPVEGDDGVVSLSLDLNDIGKYSIGLHTLYFRVAEQGGNYSPIYSSTFMKFNSGEGKALEYWFDNGFDHRSTVTIEQSHNDLIPLSLDLNSNPTFTLGLHQFHMRMVMYGGEYSPVYTSYVMRLPTGNHSDITFWVDNDYAHRKTFSSKLAGDVIQLNGLLDLSSVTPGMHYLHYRLATNGYDDGVAYQEPLLVKTRYTKENNPTIVARRSWIDDGEGGEISVGQSEVFVDNVILSPWDYSEGQHTYNVAYLNSAGVWSDTNVTYFYRDPQCPSQLKVGMIADDIAEVNADVDMPVYNLNGMKVGMSSDMKQLPRGVYIVGGKKMVVK